MLKSAVHKPDSLGVAGWRHASVGGGRGGKIHPREMIMTVCVRLASAASAERDVGRRWGWEMGRGVRGRVLIVLMQDLSKVRPGHDRCTRRMTTETVGRETTAARAML